MTLSFWVKGDFANGTAQHPIAVQIADGKSASGLGFVARTDRGDAGIALSGLSGENVGVYSLNGTDSGTWTHIVAAVDNQSERLTLYRDWNPVASRGLDDPDAISGDRIYISEAGQEMFVERRYP